MWPDWDAHPGANEIWRGVSYREISHTERNALKAAAPTELLRWLKVSAYLVSSPCNCLFGSFSTCSVCSITKAGSLFFSKRNHSPQPSRNWKIYFWVVHFFRNFFIPLREMAVPKKRPNAAAKSPPILSQEFFLQNHADFFSCIAILILLGMMLPVSFSQLLNASVLPRRHSSRRLFRFCFAFICSFVVVISPWVSCFI